MKMKLYFKRISPENCFTEFKIHSILTRDSGNLVILWRIDSPLIIQFLYISQWKKMN